MSNTSKIASALNKAQKSMGAVKKGADNPFFKSKYADLTSVIEACKEALNENGITILQPHRSVVSEPTGGETKIFDFVDTILIHDSGEQLTSSTRIVVKKENDPQALGSAISYARRYGLQSFICLPAEDDDGEGAMTRSTKGKPEKKTPAKKDTPKGDKKTSFANRRKKVETTTEDDDDDI